MSVRSRQKQLLRKRDKEELYAVPWDYNVNYNATTKSATVTLNTPFKTLNIETRFSWAKALRRAAVAFLALTGAVGFYVFSLGPITFLCGVKSTDTIDRVPSIVHALYYPLFHTPDLPGAYDHYLQFWTDKNLSPGEK